jgi:hypothetical protein
MFEGGFNGNVYGNGKTVTGMTGTETLHVPDFQGYGLQYYPRYGR